ncbi:hypothetical protein J4414_01480 [Candidatus Woesearchaeota archaeon]|nr:hypothetical protein [Candidatus Woesearchaeota archaeon]
MLNKENYLAFTFFLVFAAVFISFTDPAFTGFVSHDLNGTNQTENQTITPNVTLIPSPLLRIELTQKSFDQGRLLTGLIKLNMSGIVTQDDVLTLSTDNQISERKLVDIIRTLNVPYRELQTIYTGENPQTVKTLTFNEAGSQLVGVRIRSKSNTASFKLNVEGKELNGQFPTFPKVDIGAKSLYNDFEYYGDLASYDNTPISPSTLELTNPEEQIIITNSPKTFYCERINLPESRAFKLSAKYQRTENTLSFGDMKMKILNFPDFTPVPTGECDLPEETNLAFHDCDAVLDRPIKGEKLICFFSSKDQHPNGLAKLSIDPATSIQNQDSNGYACNEGFECDKTVPTDYYIRAFPGIYPKILSTKEEFKNWSTSPSIEILSFNNHLNICEPFDFSRTFCMVPVKISSESAGIIELSNFELKYTKDGSAFAPVTELNDLTYLQSSLELTKPVTLDIPIEVFNLAAPQTKTAVLKAQTSSGLSGEKSYDVNLIESEVTLEPIPAIKNRISISKTLLQRLQKDELTAALGLMEKMNSVFTELVKFEDTIKGIEAAINITQVEKEVKISEISTQLDEILKQVPRDYDIKTSFKFTPSSLSFEELSSEIPIKQDTSYKSAVLSLQDEVTVEAEARVVDILYTNGETKTATSITKIIKPKKPLTNVEIIEKIPKEMAQSVSEIGFDTPSTTLKDDPVVKFVISEISPESPGRITYAVYKESLDYVEDTLTLYLPASISNELIGVDCGNNYCNFLEDYTSCSEDCLCGNNVCDIGEENTCPSDCKKFPWGIVIGLILIGLLTAGGAYYYLVLYRNPEKKKAFLEKMGKIPVVNIFFKPKKLFKSQQELQSLKLFVKNASLKGYSKEQIKQTLIKKGWKPEQINEAFKP